MLAMNDVPKLTREQSAIIGCFTGICCGSFADIQELAEKLMGRPLWTHMFADKCLMDQLKEKSTTLFLSICNGS